MVTIQSTPQSTPSPPSWTGEVVAFAQVLEHAGSLKAIQEQVRFARGRFGTYDLIDFVVVLMGYAVRSEPTLKAFYERLASFAESFMALFERNQLFHRSTFSRFLAALEQPPAEEESRDGIPLSRISFSIPSPILIELTISTSLASPELISFHMPE